VTQATPARHATGATRTSSWAQPECPEPPADQTVEKLDSGSFGRDPDVTADLRVSARSDGRPRPASHRDPEGVEGLGRPRLPQDVPASLDAVVRRRLLHASRGRPCCDRVACVDWALALTPPISHGRVPACAAGEAAVAWASVWECPLRRPVGSRIGRELGLTVPSGNLHGHGLTSCS
jgi:hypothetical protein